MAGQDVIERTLVVEYVSPTPNKWDGGAVPVWYVEANFADGSFGSVACQIEENIGSVIESLNAIKGVPTAFKVVDKGTFKDRQQWGIREYNGKPETWKGGGGGGRGGGGGGMSHSQAGLLAAASALGPTFAWEHEHDVPFEPALMAAKIVQLGEVLTQHLFDRKPPEGQGNTGGSEQAAPATGNPTPVTLAQMKALKDIQASQGWTDAELLQRLEKTSLAEITPSDVELLRETFGG